MFIERKAYSKALKDLIADSDGRTNYEKGYIQGLATANGILLDKNQTPTADVVEVVRCKDCVYFQPDFVLTNDGERRPYTEEEKQSKLGMVSCEVGINCGSRCERHDYWEENQIPVWFSENDFCSYGKRKESEVQGG